MINTYAANGQKLRTKYYTAIFPVVGPILDLKDTIEVLNSTSDATMLSSPAKVSAKTIPDYISLKRTILRLDDYFGSILYENGTAEDAAHHPITKVLTPEGYVDYATAGKPYCYYRQDHLGSIREVDSYTGNNRTVVQKTQYYPSGTPFAESFGAGEQAYKFTGKEMITMHGLNWQDFGARWLDNARMQWTSMDPLSEKYYSISPYAYCKGNPIRFIDPTGMLVDDYFNEKGTYLGKDEATTDNVKITTQQSWDATKTVNSDGTESIDHATGSNISIDNSKSELSTSAELSVYDHYNSTGQTLNATSPENGDGGAAFWAIRKNGVITTGIEVNIEGNKTKPHNIADHANEIINTFVHEGKHEDDYNQLGFDGYKNMPQIYKESRAVQTEMNDITFPLMRPTIQKMKIDYGVSKGFVLPIKIQIIGL